MENFISFRWPNILAVWIMTLVLLAIVVGGTQIYKKTQGSSNA